MVEKRGSIVGERLRNFEFSKKIIFIALTISVLILVGIITYYLFFYTRNCSNGDCFFESLNNCKKVSWIKSDDLASWEYQVIGDGVKDACNVEVRLLKMNQGTVDIESLQGKSMICTVYKVGNTFPEKSMENCHGILKEDLQNIIIQRMHNYLLQNVGKIDESFSSFS